MENKVENLMEKYNGTRADIVVLEQKIDQLTKVIIRLSERLDYIEGRIDR